MVVKLINNMLDLLIITGASKGIGANIVAKCASICNNLIITASSEKIFDVELKNVNYQKLLLDLTSYKDCYHKIYNCVSKLENIKSVGIVLCGGQIGEPGGLLNSDLDNWEKLYKCNVLGNLAIVKGCLEIVGAEAKTKIVFFAGGGAAFGYPDFSGYALSKVAVVRAAENLSIELSSAGYDASVISLAPGAVDTDILKKVISSGSQIRTKTDISEPTNFVYNFLTDQLPTKELNGKFLHVRDDLQLADLTKEDIFKLRRIQ